MSLIHRITKEPIEVGQTYPDFHANDVRLIAAHPERNRITVQYPGEEPVERYPEVIKAQFAGG